MDLKKMKLILVASVALNVALIVIMLVLKNGYMEQAQTSYKTATKEYTDQVAKVVNAQNAFIQNSNVIWQLVFETTSKKLSKSAFDARLMALDTAKALNPQINGNETSVSCGPDCAVKFTFKGSNFVSVDYKALSAMSPSATFSVSKPAPFNFQAK